MSATVKQKTQVQMHLSAECPTHARTHVKADAHEIVIDEPAARGGTDRGASPTQTLLASLIGCTNVILNRVAEHAGVKIDRLSVTADATFDRRGVMLQEEIAVPFPEITLAINVTTAASDAALAKVKADLGKFCPVSKVIRQSGTKLIEVWNVSRP
jgi:putative redox protein